ncbi:concanavalin A-like lectin/glucanase domain-containing protein [Amylocystis lapponica]|nr:concanavalin A-like lectin/glucanase domain-containing protein [Amylocystis lapponica]
MMRSTVLSVLVLLSPALAAEYQMVKYYEGSTFFDDWQFYDTSDTFTSGNVNYLSEKTASKDGLAYINNAGNAVIRVDNSSTVTLGQNRNSVRIATNDLFEVGSVWISDFLHVPYGCSVWPSFWSSSQIWPAGGEIDTFEGVNQVTMNQMTLHTSAGCTHSSSAVQSSTLVNSTDCNTALNGNQGCAITDPSTSSYGAAFANDGGGVFVTEFASSGISIWFFNRSSIPDSLQGNATTVNTTAIGTPVANWPASSCTISQFFNPQRLIFDITLCGTYAGNTAVFSETCSGVCYDDYVTGPPSNYDNAYFEVQYVRVYGVPGEVTVVPISGATARWSLATAAALGGVLLVGVVLAL